MNLCVGPQNDLLKFLDGCQLPGSHPSLSQALDPTSSFRQHWPVALAGFLQVMSCLSSQGCLWKSNRPQSGWSIYLSSSVQSGCRWLPGGRGAQGYSSSFLPSFCWLLFLAFNSQISGPLKALRGSLLFPLPTASTTEKGEVELLRVGQLG